MTSDEAKVHFRSTKRLQKYVNRTSENSSQIGFILIAAQRPKLPTSGQGMASGLEFWSYDEIAFALPFGEANPQKFSWSNKERKKRATGMVDVQDIVDDPRESSNLKCESCK